MQARRRGLEQTTRDSTRAHDLVAGATVASASTEERFVKTLKALSEMSESAHVEMRRLNRHVNHIRLPAESNGQQPFDRDLALRARANEVGCCFSCQRAQRLVNAGDRSWVWFRSWP